MYFDGGARQNAEQNQVVFILRSAFRTSNRRCLDSALLAYALVAGFAVAEVVRYASQLVYYRTNL